MRGCLSTFISLMFRMCRLSSVGRASHSYRLFFCLCVPHGKPWGEKVAKTGEPKQVSCWQSRASPCWDECRDFTRPTYGHFGYGEEKVQTTNITFVMAMKIVVGMKISPSMRLRVRVSPSAPPPQPCKQ